MTGGNFLFPHNKGHPMPAQKGKDLLIKIGDGGNAFVTVAGLRTRQIAFNAETVDVTHADPPGGGASSWPASACAAPRSPAQACSRTRPRTRACARSSST